MKPRQPWWRRKWLRLLAVYLVLLGVSHLWRAFVDEPGTPLPGQQTVELPELARVFSEVPGSPPVEPTGGTITLAYRDIPAVDPDAPVLVLLHGMPIASRSMNPLLAELRGRYRLIVPDLPGFGGSTLRLPDYSTRAHAAYLVHLLDYLEIEEVHALGFSQGGGVIINLSELAPERVGSLMMVGAIGVIEEELLGRYDLNQALYRIQLFGLTLLQEGFPHFGWIDDAALNVPYARNFQETDMRPFRELLLAYDGPMLILHGREDPLVPLPAAEEHARLVPQAELVLFEASHFFLFRDPAMVAEHLEPFLERVTAGTALVRDTADPERIRQSKVPYEPSGEMLTGLALLIVLFLLFAATFASEDLACIGAGILASQGVVPFADAALACALGIYVGDFGLYAIGRLSGSRALRFSPVRWITGGRNLDRFALWLRRRGAILIALSRFLPGSRVPLYITAGMVRMPWWVFGSVLIGAVAIWVPALMGLSYKLGGMALEKLAAFGVWALPGLIVVVLLIWFGVRVVAPLATWRGRRLALGRIRRWTHWEYWPGLVVYLPVVGMLLRRKFFGQRLSVFTAANPGIPHGGFIGESKAEILNSLGTKPTDRGAKVAPFLLLDPACPPESLLERLRPWQTTLPQPWPLVLKPDVGERGRGVVFPDSENSLLAALRERQTTTLAQVYIPGEEFGLFYVRHPAETTGQIFGITKKSLPTITGDGLNSLEHCILQDDRHIAMARLFFRGVREEDRQRVPDNGERVVLSELGTHSRGALFEDATDQQTPALLAATDELSRPFAGFFFGRYDVRAESLAALQEGRFAVIELNGVTSEATNLYDPKYRLREGIHILLEQWRLAMAIGQANAERGAHVTPLPELIRLWWRTRQEARED